MSGRVDGISYVVYGRRTAGTVGAHLRNVYAKLGVRSRVELAREQDALSCR